MSDDNSWDNSWDSYYSGYDLGLDVGKERALKAVEEWVRETYDSHLSTEGNPDAGYFRAISTNAIFSFLKSLRETP